MLTLFSLTIWIILFSYWNKQKNINILIYNITVFITAIFIFSYFFQFLFQVFGVNSAQLNDHKFVTTLVPFEIEELVFLIASIFFSIIVFFLIKLSIKFKNQAITVLRLPRQNIRILIIFLVFFTIIIKIILKNVFNVHVPGVIPIPFPAQGIVVYSIFAILLIGIPLIYEMNYKKTAFFFLVWSFGIDILSGWRGQLILLFISFLILFKFKKRIRLEMKYIAFIIALMFLYAFTEPLLLSIRNPMYDISEYDFFSSLARFFYRIIGYDSFLFVYNHFINKGITLEHVILLGGPVKYFTFVIEGVPSNVVTESTPGFLGNLFILFNYYTIVIGTIIIYFVIRIQLYKWFFISHLVNGYLLVHLLFYIFLGDILWTLKFYIIILFYLWILKIVLKIKA